MTTDPASAGFLFGRTIISAYLSPIGNAPQCDANGAPLSGGKVHTYVAGSVSTPAATYTTSAGTVPQANPIILNSRGIPANPVWLAGGSAYKIVIADANDVVLQTIDNVQGINDPTAVTVQDQWIVFTGTPTFLSATSFSVVGDQTPTLQVGRRVKTTNAGGTVYSTISAASFAAGVTTVTVVNDASTLDAGLSSVSYGMLSYTSSSVPRQPGELIGVRVISATGTYTPSAGTNTVVVELGGGGGAGGGAATTGVGQVAAGTGGSAGGYAKSRLTTGFAGITVTIGAGGVGAAGATGGNGGASSFGAVFSATGGTGGTLGAAVGSGTITFVRSGVGGAGSSGNLVNATGQPGGHAFYISGTALSGFGGASMFGGGGAAVQDTNGGVAATSFGAGGSGGALLASSGPAAGGGGAQGICLVWEYA